MTRKGVAISKPAKHPNKEHYVVGPCNAGHGFCVCRL